MDLDFFDTDHRSRDDRRRHRDDRRRDDRDRDRGYARTRRDRDDDSRYGDRRWRHRDADDAGRGRSYRRKHPHVFAWALMAGGAFVLGLLAVALLQATGLMSPLADLYFGATTALMPTIWHDEWMAIPDAGHAVMAVVALALVAGMAGEALEFLD